MGERKFQIQTDQRHKALDKLNHSQPVQELDRHRDFHHPRQPAGLFTALCRRILLYPGRREPPAGYPYCRYARHHVRPQRPDPRRLAAELHGDLCAA